MSHAPHFRGSAQFEWLSDGRRMKLLADFAYIDARRLEWPVPKHAIVDGASIPQILWSVTGGPYEGLYRNASVVHDWYCDLRTRPWRAVHRMFYEAMLTSGVSPARAGVMYAAVFYGGPRWSETASANANLATEERWGGQGGGMEGSSGSSPGRAGINSEFIRDGAVPGSRSTSPEEREIAPVVWQRQNVDPDTFSNLADVVERENLSPDEIDALVHSQAGNP